MARASTSDTAQYNSDLQAMIAEAAYFKSEKRGFMPGFEITDWLDAERELAATMAKPASKPQRKTKSEAKSSKKKKKQK